MWTSTLNGIGLDKLVDMLNPKPLSYNPSGKVTFESPWEGGAEKAGR